MDPDELCACGHVLDEHEGIGGACQSYVSFEEYGTDRPHEAPCPCIMFEADDGEAVS